MLAGDDPGDSARAQLARTLLGMAQMEAIPVQASLYRGTDGSEFLDGQLDEMLSKLSSDQSVTIAQPLVSWTDTPEVWDGWKYRWILKPESDQGSLLPSVGSMALPLGPFADSNATEFVTGGLLKVVRIEGSTKPAEPTMIFVEQTTYYAQ